MLMSPNKKVQYRKPGEWDNVLGFGMLTIILWLSGTHMGSHDFKLIMIMHGLIP